MEETTKDDIGEITDRNYRKLAESLEKEGFREGASDGCDSIFQESFDAGYEDGFKIGYFLGKKNEENAKLGRCEMCRDKELINKTESEVREIVRRTYENLVKA